MIARPTSCRLRIDRLRPQLASFSLRLPMQPPSHAVLVHESPAYGGSAFREQLLTGGAVRRRNGTASATCAAESRPLPRLAGAVTHLQIAVDSLRVSPEETLFACWARGLFEVITSPRPGSRCTGCMPSRTCTCGIRARSPFCVLVPGRRSHHLRQMGSRATTPEKERRYREGSSPVDLAPGSLARSSSLAPCRRYSSSSHLRSDAFAHRLRPHGRRCRRTPPAGRLALLSAPSVWTYMRCSCSLLAICPPR